MSKNATIEDFKERCSKTMEKINTLEQFRESDEMVDFVVRQGRSLFDTPLDVQAQDSLLRIGGKLTGAYAYFGQKSARARAERDVYEQKLDEVMKELILKYVGSNYKVTQARAYASVETVELNEIILLKNSEKNQWENITNATQTMIMFIQSALRVKDSEYRQSNRMQSQ